MARQKNLHTTARKIIESCAGWNSRLAARRIGQFIDREMAGTGLSLAQFALMGQIAAASDDTLGALAQRCDLDPSTLSRNLRQLEKDELVEIVTIENDLRRRAVWLTEKGARKLEAAVPAWSRAQAKLAKLSLPDLARQLARETEALGTATNASSSDDQ
ncbi:MAG TPA: MarR family winged helix-turn-helix transcriptional regulator [Dongiaceae bacterium]|nr:MarR family winged helix-turn-helix transcriptional regulator [Dongiaceae bacterium]